jgi:hypothetical protein
MLSVPQLYSQNLTKIGSGSPQNTVFTLLPAADIDENRYVKCNKGLIIKGIPGSVQSVSTSQKKGGNENGGSENASSRP